jgi:hypothetical protein
MALGPFPGIEIHAYGLTVLSKSFEVFPTVARTYALKHGAAREDERGRIVAAGDWIPLDIWAEMLARITVEVGPNVLFRCGMQMVEHPNLPPLVRDLEGALRAIDIAFHRSHRKAGRVMYDLATREMLEGIGHYAVAGAAADRRFLVTCDTPYPCVIDFGVVTEIARKFEPRAVVAHDEIIGCREKGAKRCAYVVTW